MEIQTGGQPKEKEVSINSRYQTADGRPWFRPITSPSLPSRLYSPCLAQRLWKGEKQSETAFSHQKNVVLLRSKTGKTRAFLTRGEQIKQTVDLVLLLGLGHI